MKKFRFKVINFHGKNLGFFQDVDSAVRLATWNKDKTSTQQVVDVVTGKVVFVNCNGHTEWL
jgi:hypothetical protein